MNNNSHSQDEAFVNPDFVKDLRDMAYPLRLAEDLAPLMTRVGNSRMVLLGEATHGTREFYTWRTSISQKLIQEKAFQFVAIEADWPDSYQLNRYIKNLPGAEKNAFDALSASFRRWPAWKWANQEMLDFIEWLRAYNDELEKEHRVGFYGLDIYSLWDSLNMLKTYIKHHAPEFRVMFDSIMDCFQPFGQDPMDYARRSMESRKTCEVRIGDLITLLEQRHTGDFDEHAREVHFNALQNAFVIKNAEAYYRALIRGDAEAWDIRERHMADTLDRVAAHLGPQSKAIVWEHNVHIGDARFTERPKRANFNFGQVVRERYGEGDSLLLGFTSHHGHVVASRDWDKAMSVMQVPTAQPGSWEDVFHRAGAPDKLLIFDAARQPEELSRARRHRAIGVIYDPMQDPVGNYFSTVIAKRYDALIHIDETHALQALRVQPIPAGSLAETYPSAF